MNTVNFYNLIDLLALPILLALSIYHFLIYRGRRKYTEEHYNFYFSVFTFFLVIYLFINSPLFISSETGWKNRNWLPPIDGAVIFILLYSFTAFFSKLLNFPSNKMKYIRLGNYCLLFSLSLTIFSLIKSWEWYGYHIAKFVVGLTAVYILCIFYLFGSWILKAKLYKDKVIKIIIAGTGFLIFYLLVSKSLQAFYFFYFFYRNNLIVTGVLYVFAYALAVKFNLEYEELVLLKNNLEEKVTERTAELTKAKEQIEEAKEQIETVSREKTDFFVNLAHETKTPLTIISNYLERYINKHAADEEIGIIKKNIDKLCKDMVDFLDMEKLMQGSFSYENEQISDFSKLLDDKISLFKEYAGKKDLSLSAGIENGLFVKCDPKLVDRIIFNLIENAIKYTAPGGEINVKLCGTGGDIIFKVSDNGIGIPEAKLTHIFEPYYQISHKKLNTQGMGMGLYIVKRSVELLNGSINVESSENTGSSFTVRLPLYSPAGGEEIISYSSSKSIIPEGEIIKKEIDSQKRNILLVEDNIDMLNYLIEELSDNYNIYAAKNGAEALKRIVNIKIPDLIISDMMMDQMDGEEFYTNIINNIRYQNVPFIFLTAKTVHEEKVKMLEAGVRDYINKPFSITELKARIKTIIENSTRQKKEGLKQAIDVITRELNDPEKPVPDKWQIFEERSRHYELTDRQKEIASLIAEGLEYKEIADKLNISYRTVTNHVENLFDKLNIHNKIDLINLLFR